MKRSIAGLTAVVVMTMCLPSSAETVTDSFDDGVLDPVWQVVTQNGGASWVESAGALYVGGSSGQTGELIIRYNRALADVSLLRIDYNWLSYSGHKARVGLGLFSYDSYWGGGGANTAGRCVYVKGVRYQSTGLHAVDGGTGEGMDYHIAYSVPTSGSLMIERNGNDFRVSYIDGGVWQNLFEAQHDFGGTPLYPYIFTSNSDTNPSWQVTLDNFSADVVPEPSTFILLVVGIAVLLMSRHK